MVGDREYKPGDRRELLESEAAPLLASGALVEAKIEPRLEIKTEPRLSRKTRDENVSE